MKYTHLLPTFPQLGTKDYAKLVATKSLFSFLFVNKYYPSTLSVVSFNQISIMAGRQKRKTQQ